MTFDDSTDEITGWLNGVSGERWLGSPGQVPLLSSATNAYMQGHWNRMAGIQKGENPEFPADQYYNPPEDEPASVEVVVDNANERIEIREYRYTKVRVTLTKHASGEFAESGRHVIALRTNPWWYPHGIYSPADSQSGGPFTIGRVIHTSRSVGFTGWIGGVAVFDRALDASELSELSKLRDDVCED